MKIIANIDRSLLISKKMNIFSSNNVKSLKEGNQFVPEFFANFHFALISTNNHRFKLKWMKKSLI